MLKTFSLIALLLLGLLPQATLANPSRPSFREAKADYHPSELTLSYNLGPGAVDLALAGPLAIGVAMDQISPARSWLYRATYQLLNSEFAGMDLALKGGVSRISGREAGDVYLPQVWGYEAGILATFPSDAGVLWRLGISWADTDWQVSGGGEWHINPEVAYRFGPLEAALAPSWPISLQNVSFIGLRLRF
jgi:hypothetical protein